MERLAHEPKPPKLPSDYSFPAMPRRWADETESEEMREWLENFANARAQGVRERGSVFSETEPAVIHGAMALPPSR